jgi:hypothetical protein
MATSLAERSAKKRADAKMASTRLLDMLAGWSAYTSADEENNIHDPALKAEDIGRIYQLAGTLCLSWEKLDPKDNERAVSEFVNEQVIPLLLR